MNHLDKKLVVITGGTKGLGLAISSALLAGGYKIVAASRSCGDEFNKLKANYSDSIVFEPIDLTATDSIYLWTKKIVSVYGIPYSLVNNSAIGLDGFLGTMHESDIHQLISVNLTAPILLSKYFSRQMLSRKCGRIVNVSSIIANTGFSGLSVYGATKAGLNGFTKSLARELGKANITVNAIAPGYMQTEMTKGLQGDKLDSIIRRSPLHKLTGVDQVAPMVLFLLNETGNAMTGSIITIDSGSTC